jgi:hypothetical protein
MSFPARARGRGKIKFCNLAFSVEKAMSLCYNEEKQIQWGGMAAKGEKIWTRSELVW